MIIKFLLKILKDIAINVFGFLAIALFSIVSVMAGFTVLGVIGYLLHFIPINWNWAVNKNGIMDFSSYTFIGLVLGVCVIAIWLLIDHAIKTWKEMNLQD